MRERNFWKGFSSEDLSTEVSWQKDLKLAWWKKSWKGRGWGEEEILHSMTSCFYHRLSVFLGKGIAKWHPVPPPLPQQIASQRKKDLKLTWWKKSWKGRGWGEEEILHSMTSCFCHRLSVFLGKGIAKWHPVPPPLPQQIASQSPLC